MQRRSCSGNWATNTEGKPGKPCRVARIGQDRSEVILAGREAKPDLQGFVSARFING
jgi:hypothetical protein